MENSSLSQPIHQFGFIIAGAGVRSIPATPDEDMLRALDRAVRHSVPKPTALIENFPSNPTAYLADLDFYKEIVAFARKHVRGAKVWAGGCSIGRCLAEEWQKLSYAAIPDDGTIRSLA